MFTKISAFTFAALFLFLSGCGGGGGDGMTEIVIWEQKDPVEQTVLNRQLDAYTSSHPGVTVSTVHFETDLLHSQFQTATLAGGGPDLVYGPSDKIGPYSVMQLIMPMENMFDAAFLGAYEKSSLAMLEGHIYAVPDQIGNHLMLIYNKAMVKSVPKDTDEWIEMCRGLTVDDNGDGMPEIYGVVFNAVEPFWLVPFLGGFGGRVMDSRYAPTLDTPEMARALAFMADLRNKHKILPKECNYELSDTMFKKGQAAFIINGPWSLKAYIEAGMEIGVMALPMITETGRYPAPMVSSKGYSISVNVKEEKLALVKDLLVYLTSEPVQREITSELKILPAISSLFNDEALLSDPVLKGSMEQARHGQPMPSVPEMRAIWDAMRPFYQSVMGGKLDPAKAAKDMQEQAVRKIAEMKG
ncbi:MAG: extracellular solute-binding protein [Candidatus Krumholzibacteria bacterium]|nr:extracellular solute-binding protein [Candidatus Krumholzibacteria bacterium]